MPEETWAFATYITSKEGELDEVAINQTTPSRVSVMNSRDFWDPAKQPKGMNTLVNGQEYVVGDPVHARWPDIDTNIVDKLLDEQLWSGKAPAAQVTKLIKDQSDPLLKG